MSHRLFLSILLLRQLSGHASHSYRYLHNSHFKYKPGQRVELIRAGRGDDEVTSSGTIVSGFEGVFEVCYKVKLDNGLYKEAVPEDEISDKVTSDMGDLFGDW